MPSWGVRMSGPTVEELREELARLMREYLDSVKRETFVTLSQEEIRQQTELMKRIREVSADYLASLKKISQ
jgi:hypothetical protein